jgi:hypothetical protein
MEIKDFHTSVEYPNEMRTEWFCSKDSGKEEHFDPWFFDGQKRIPLLMSHLRKLPEEPGGYKEGEFMKGEQDHFFDQRTIVKFFGRKF